MKRIAIIFTVIVFPFLVTGQVKKFEYTPKVKNKVKITNMVGELSLQNSAGNTLVIESDFNTERPERAAGLKLLGTMEDNTELGLNVSEENGVVSIQGTTNSASDFKYKIMVPAGMAVNLDYERPFAIGGVGDVIVDSYVGSLEVKTLNSNVKITKSSGPFTVNTISGNVVVVFDKINQSEPTSLASMNGFIDVTVPGTEKATIEISSMMGNVYNNLDLKNTSSAKDKDNRSSGLNTIKQQGGNNFTLNGGGQKIYIKGMSGDIYLRKL